MGCVFYKYKLNRLCSYWVLGSSFTSCVAWSAQAVIWNWSLRNKLQWNFNRNSCIFIKKIYLKMLCGKRRPFCLGLNVLNLCCVLLQIGLCYGQPPVHVCTIINTSRPSRNRHHFADDIFKCIFLMKISQKFIPKGPITNIPSLV